MILSFPGGVPSVVDVALYNALGRKVPRGTDRKAVSLRHLPQGVLFLEVGGETKGKLILP